MVNDGKNDVGANGMATTLFVIPAQAGIYCFIIPDS